MSSHILKKSPIALTYSRIVEGVTEKHLWEEITAELKQLGHIKMNRKKTGATRKIFLYYSEMDNIIGKRHDIGPPMVSGTYCIQPVFTGTPTMARKKQKVDTSVTEPLNEELLVNDPSSARSQHR